jgi:endoglucanase
MVQCACLSLVLVLLAFTVADFTHAQPATEPAPLLLATDADGPRLLGVSLVSKNTVLVEIAAQRVVYNTYQPHTIVAGEQIAEPLEQQAHDDGNGRYLFTGVRGDGAQSTILGLLSPDNQRLRVPDTVVGDKLDIDWARLAESYTLNSATAPGFTVTGASPANVSVKSKLHSQSQWGTMYWSSAVPVGSSGVGVLVVFTTRYWLTLEFGGNVAFGHDYLLAFNAGAAASPAGSASFGGLAHAFGLPDGSTPFSEAVHVNQIGFFPTARRNGYLSFWRGEAGGVDYSTEPVLYGVVVAATGAVVEVAAAAATLRKPAGTAENDAGHNFSEADVYDLDMNALVLPEDTDLKLCVIGVGCSFSFQVSTSAYMQPLKHLLRVFYYQRDGVALSNTYDGFMYTRPRTLHPGDVKLVHTTVTLADVGNGSVGGASDGQGFTEIAAGATENLCGANFYGGWMDAGACALMLLWLSCVLCGVLPFFMSFVARVLTQNTHAHILPGDWDTRALHLKAARKLMQLLDEFPEVYTNLDLGVAEDANNGVPDLLDQALWDVDYYARIQTADGGVSGGVEAAAHPRPGEKSFDNSQTWYCYAPDMLSTYWFAASAAFASELLAAYDVPRSAALAAKARLAWTYAELHRNDPIGGPAGRDASYAEQRGDARVTAAVYLLRMGGVVDTALHTVFTTDSLCSGAAYLIGSYDQTEASLVYSKLDAATFGTSTTLQQQCRVLLTAYYKRVLAPAVANTGFRVLQPGFFTEFHLTASAFAGSLVAAADAAQLSTAGDDASVTAEAVALLGVTLDYTWGSNPLNTVYVTDGGNDAILGSRNFRHPLRSDSLYSDAHAPPGLTVTGPVGPSTAPALGVASPSSFDGFAFPGYPIAMAPAADSAWPWFEFVFSNWQMMGECECDVSFVCLLSFVRRVCDAVCVHARSSLAHRYAALCAECARAAPRLLLRNDAPRGPCRCPTEPILRRGGLHSHRRYAQHVQRAVCQLQRVHFSRVLRRCVDADSDCNVSSPSVCSRVCICV